MPPARRLPMLVAALAMATCASPALAAKVTECARVGLCYCMNDDHRAAIDAKIDKVRQVIAEQRKAGKAVVYLSVPLSASGGGNFKINQEVAESVRQAVEKRFGAEYIWVLNPGTPDADLPKGAGGSEYMVMWTAVLEGADGLGDFDAAYFAGPQDFARYFGFDGTNDMAKLDAYFDKRVAADPDFAKAVQNGLTRPTFRRYYALRASSTVSRGAHDEWNVFRIINDKRRADAKFGTPGQIPIVFDGQGVAPPHHESNLSDGYVGKCPL
ncbi:MAG: hypothetical protein ABI593_06880 [Betaproteobacteria bacterium]